ncbi:hypothetical protein EDB19DRAFT_1348296 [Suillus lakei]|nr:hypothetical protein EDB19DRAFT_1348296 [Suillus lakei]
MTSIPACRNSSLEVPVAFFLLCFLALCTTFYVLCCIAVFIGERVFVSSFYAIYSFTLSVPFYNGRHEGEVGFTSIYSVSFDAGLTPSTSLSCEIRQSFHRSGRAFYTLVPIRLAMIRQHS